MNKKRIAVLMGGKTPEFSVSISSGIQVVNSLDKNRYVVIPLVVSQSGEEWFVTDEVSLSLLPNLLDKEHLPKTVEFKTRIKVEPLSFLSKEIDIVFIATHGPYREDGSLQGLLEIAGVKYTGSNVLTSAVGMDKLMFRRIMNSIEVDIPKYISAKKNQDLSKIKNIIGKPPYFVKPNSQGSSVGASIAKTEKDLDTALNLAWEYGEIALVDEYITGIEITCSILGNENPQALPLIEIIPASEFFDYSSKYSDNTTQEIVPAKINQNLTKNIQKVALKIYKELNCRGFARVDFILKPDGKFDVLEINTIPGLTSASLMPKAAKAFGMSYCKLLDTIIKHAQN